MTDVSSLSSVVPPRPIRARPGYVPTVRAPGVYRPQHDTMLMQEVLRDSGAAAGADVLDVCTGSGALALTAGALGAANVTAVDLSARSVATTWVNGRLQGLTLEVLRGDLFDPVAGRRFDLIVANPPYVPALTGRLPRHRAARCWDGGLDGRHLVDRICAGARDALRPGGQLLLVHSTVTGEDATVAALRRTGLAADVIARRRTPFGPVMTARAQFMAQRGLPVDLSGFEDLVVVRAAHA